MSRDPFGRADRLLGGLLGTVFLLLVLMAVLPVIGPWLIVLGVLSIVGRLVWVYANRW